MTLVFDEPEELPTPGQVTLDRRVVGEVRSVERSPRFGTLGLAVLDADLAVDGAFVQVDGITAVVRPRPIDDEDRARRARPGG